jgi:hypothetical protein
MTCGISIDQWAQAKLMENALARQTLNDDPNHKTNHCRAPVNELNALQLISEKLLIRTNLKALFLIF